MDQTIDALRMREQIYAFLAQAYRFAPTVESLKLLAGSNSSQAEAFGLTEEVDFEEMRRVLEAEFNRVFLGMSAHAVAPYESVFTSPEKLLMQDARDQVRAFYRAAQVEIATEENLPEDHIAFEFGFMRHLCERTIEHFEQGNSEEAQQLMQVQKDFFQQHLANWLPAFCEAATAQVKTNYYQQVVRATNMLVEEEQDFFS